jgi:hypothetical protein
MNLVLTDRTCKVCQAKLSEYEAKNNDGLCIDCYKEEKKETK